MKLEEFKEGDRVVYVPGHAFGDRTHKDSEWGTVSSINSKFVFVRFDKAISRLGWDGATSKSCRPEDLEK